MAKKNRTNRDTITARLGTIDGGYELQHDIDQAKINAIARHLATGGVIAPVLLVESDGNGYTVLDGHHRLMAIEQFNRDADWDRTYELGAWIVDRAEFESLIAEKFDGEMPLRMADLDKWIEVDGKTYNRG